MLTSHTWGSEEQCEVHEGFVKKKVCMQRKNNTDPTKHLGQEVEKLVER